MNDLTNGTANRADFRPALNPFGVGPIGLGRASVVDEAAILTSVGFLLFGLCAALFVRAWNRRERLETGDRRRVLPAIGGSLQLVCAVLLPFTADLLEFFVLWELISLGAVLVLASEPGRGRLLRTYLPIQIAGAIALIVAIAAHYAEAGSLGLTPDGLQAGAPFALFAVLVKAAVFPLHLWMVETYPRVSPAITVMLSAFGTKSGVFAAYRLIPGLPGLELLGALSALLAVLYALRQRRLRPFLTFHIASQIGYMIAGIGGLTAASQLAGVYHLSNHVMYKGLLLMCAAVLIRRYRTEDMYLIRNLGSRTNLAVGVAALVGALAISGVPPFNGFVSKAFLKAHASTPAVYWLLVGASIGTAMSFTKFLWLSFLGGHLLGARDVLDRKILSATRPRSGRPWTRPGEAVGMATLACACAGMTFLPLVIFPELSFVYLFSRLVLAGGVWPAAVGAAGFVLVYPHLLRGLKLLPNGAAAGRRLLVAGAGFVRSVRNLHTGDLRDSIAWMIVGLVAVWLVTLIL